ncbi:MAG TPA: single-stranded DNA-binding protein [Candidatus Lumbricidophila sp.]|nr:single-stranded DNA-binding protein [Candidatus Lumbricidophila sp.]
MTAQTTTIGNLVADPECRFTSNGKAIANFTVASTEKKFDRTTNTWVDGKKLFMRCSAWGELAEHVTASLAKGMQVIAVGRISTREWDDKDGNRRSSIEMDVDAVGPSLRYATASVTRAARQNQGQDAAGDSWATVEPGSGVSALTDYYDRSESAPF